MPCLVSTLLRCRPCTSWTPPRWPRIALSTLLTSPKSGHPAVQVLLQPGRRGGWQLRRSNLVHAGRHLRLHARRFLRRRVGVRFHHRSLWPSSRNPDRCRHLVHRQFDHCGFLQHRPAGRWPFHQRLLRRHLQCAGARLRIGAGSAVEARPSRRCPAVGHYLGCKSSISGEKEKPRSTF